MKNTNEMALLIDGRHNNSLIITLNQVEFSILKYKQIHSLNRKEYKFI